MVAAPGRTSSPSEQATDARLPPSTSCPRPLTPWCFKVTRRHAATQILAGAQLTFARWTCRGHDRCGGGRRTRVAGPHRRPGRHRTRGAGPVDRSTSGCGPSMRAVRPGPPKRRSWLMPTALSIRAGLHPPGDPAPQVRGFSFAEDGLVGPYVRPAGVQRGPGVLVLGGSEGGDPAFSAMIPAARGIPALSVASDRPGLLDLSPSATANCAYVPGSRQFCPAPAWLRGGKPVPYQPLPPRLTNSLPTYGSSMRWRPNTGSTCWPGSVPPTTSSGASPEDAAEAPGRLLHAPGSGRRLRAARAPPQSPALAAHRRPRRDRRGPEADGPAGSIRGAGRTGRVR